MFYFSTKERKLRYADNRGIRTGRTHKVSGRIDLCANGLHASKRLIDALMYAPGPVLWLVKLSGEVIHDTDKSVASQRTYISGYDITDTLRLFARLQALINIRKIKPYCSDQDYALILEYLNTGDEKIRLAAESAAESARSAARSAAESAVYSAWSAARSAYSAESAAWSAAESAAWSAAYSAAWSAAWSAAESAAESAYSAARSAAESAYSAARSAAESAANNMLMYLVRQQTGWNI